MMVKQHESVASTTKYTVAETAHLRRIFGSVLLSVFAITPLKAPTATEKDIVSVFNKSPNKTLDALIPGPYTSAYKRSSLEKKLFTLDHIRSQIEMKDISEILSTPHLGEKIPKRDFSFYEFVARRTTTDELWITEKSTRKQMGEKWGYTPPEFYKVYQELSFYLQARNKKAISLLPEKFFSTLDEITQLYTLDAKRIIDGFLHQKKGSPLPEEKKTLPDRADPNSIYRDHPHLERTSYSTVEIETLRHDRKTAAAKLQEHGYRLRSSNRQDEETGEGYAGGDTSLEGITEDAIQGLTTLIKELKNDTPEKPPTLTINGGTEGVDHRMGQQIISGYFKSGISKLPKHAKAHGAGYTVDIRLTGEEIVSLKKIFPGKEGLKNIGKSVYVYDFHGGGAAYHLHLHIFSAHTYQKLFGRGK